MCRNSDIQTANGSTINCYVRFYNFKVSHTISPALSLSLSLSLPIFVLILIKGTTCLCRPYNKTIVSEIPMPVTSRRIKHPELETQKTSAVTQWAEGAHSGPVDDPTPKALSASKPVSVPRRLSSWRNSIAEV